MKKINLLITAFLILLLHSCKKEEDFKLDPKNFTLTEESTPYSSSSKSPDELKTDFFNYFTAIEQKGIGQSRDSEECSLNPLGFEIDWNSGYIPSYFGENSMIFDIVNTPVVENNKAGIQVLCKIENGEYSIQSLLYVPNQSFYNESQYTPRLFNFTGEVISISSDEYVTNKYTFSQGEIINTYPPLGLTRPKCPKWGTPWYDSFWDWIIGIFSGGGTGSGDGSGGSWNSGGWSGGWGNHQPNTTTGPTGGGGGGTSNIEPCQEPSFWSNIDFLVRKDYIDAVSNYMDVNNFYSCADPFAPEGASCVDANDLLCYAVNENCFDGSPFIIGDFTECIAEFFNTLENTNDAISCNDNALNFISNYNLTSSNGETMGVFEFKQLVNGFIGDPWQEVCGSQEEFNRTSWSIITNDMMNELIAEGLITNDDPMLNEVVASSITNIITAGWLAGPYPENLQEDIIQLYEFPGTPSLSYPEYITWLSILLNKWTEENPNQTPSTLDLAKISLEASWKTSIGTIHTALDLCGLIPLGGEPCDLINGTLYTIEGDGVNATLSFAATIPIVGWPATGTKWAKIAVSTTDGPIALALRKRADGIIEFDLPPWYQTTFRKMVGVTDPSKIAHHLIPKSLFDNPVIQKAALSKDIPYHIHHPANGKGIPDNIHNAPHLDYIAAVKNKLGTSPNQPNTIYKKIADQYGSLENAVPDNVTTKVKQFQSWLDELLENNPTTPLNDLASQINNYIP